MSTRDTSLNMVFLAAPDDGLPCKKINNEFLFLFVIKIASHFHRNTHFISILPGGPIPRPLLPMSSIGGPPRPLPPKPPRSMPRPPLNPPRSIPLPPRKPPGPPGPPRSIPRPPRIPPGPPRPRSPPESQKTVSEYWQCNYLTHCCLGYTRNKRKRQ